MQVMHLMSVAMGAPQQEQPQPQPQQRRPAISTADAPLYAVADSTTHYEIRAYADGRRSIVHLDCPEAARFAQSTVESFHGEDVRHLYCAACGSTFNTEQPMGKHGA